MGKKGQFVPVSTLGDLTELLNHNCRVLEKRLAKLTRRNRSVAVLAIAAFGYAVWAEMERRKQEEEVYQLSVRVKKLEYGEGEYEEREKRYLDTINKYEKSQQHIFPELYADVVMALDENPEQDFLGEMFMDLRLDYEELKQIFTPYHVCQLMADVTIGDLVQQVEDLGYVSINDCCCGAGANLIAAINSARRKLEDAGLNFQNHILVSGQDIEELVALMCYIQISLLGVAGYVKVDNALTEPMTYGDSMENYWFTPMYFSDVWHTRRMIHRFTELFKEDK